MPGPSTTCAPSGPCFLAGTCNPTTGTCSNPFAPAGSPCGDSNACSGIEACNGLGACVPGIPPVIDDGNPCTIDTCDPVLGAVHAPAPTGTACGNANACDGNETCDGAGACQTGSPPTIDDGNPCTDDACDPSTGVVHTPRPAGDLVCNDADACNGVEACDGSGTCVAGTPPVIDDGNVCTVDECSPIIGPVHTPIPGCDPTPTAADARFETRASIIGQLVDRAGAPITAATFTVYDERRSGAPRSDVVPHVGADGSFRLRLTSFPETEPERSPTHRLVLVVAAPGKLPAQRVTFARPGDAIGIGRIRLIERDPQVTNIGPAGGTASDSRNRIQVVVPPGALTTTVPIQITPFDQRDDFPAPLPSSTLTTYGVELEPSGTTFAVPATVRIANTLNLPTTLTIPVGVYNEPEGEWETLGQGAWDGSRFSFQTPHFSTADMNLGVAMDLVLHVTADGPNANKGDEQGCTGSSWSMQGGGMSDHFVLPTIHAGGEDFGVGLHYSSGLGSSRKTGAPPPVATGTSAVPKSSLAVALPGAKAKTECVTRGGESGGPRANTPGSCSTSSVVGTCGVGGAVALNISTLNVLNQLGVNAPTNATEVSDGSSWMEIPFATDGTPSADSPIARSAFFPQTLSMVSMLQSTCAGGGSGASAMTFGAADPMLPRTTVALEPGPLTTLTRRVLVHHRFTSPYGSGWAIDAASRVYTDGDHAILVAGNGKEEEFHPRARVDTTGLTAMRSVNAVAAFARDPLTGESFVALTATNNIARIDPTTGTLTNIVSNVGLSGRPVHGLAIAYVGGERRFVLAHAQGIVDVPSGGSPRTLVTRSIGAGVFLRMSIAARGANAFFTTGDSDANRGVLYKLDLAASAPTPEPVSSVDASGLGMSLYPTLPLGSVRFTALKGLAFGDDGSLYVADSRRHMIYRLVPDASGVISGASRVEGVVGDGSSTSIAPTGERFAGRAFALNQPHHLAMSEDGYLFIELPLGVAVYDTHSKEAEMLLLDRGREEIAAQITEQSGPLPSLLPMSKTSFLTTSIQGVLRINIDLLSSQLDPTRTIAREPSGSATLTDTSQAIVDTFDTRGRLVEHRRRTGKLLYRIQYADADSDRIDRITNAVGGAFVFAYNNGKLSSITDPSGAVSSFTVDAHGDLTAFVEPDGESHQFDYDAHKITTKTDPRGAQTHYTYAPDGTLATTQKPSGETYELHASISTPPAYTTAGKLQVGGSFTDPHGVVHTFFQNDWGGIEKEIYVADGVTYTREAVVPDFLTFYETPDEAPMRRSNQVMRRVSQWKLNGVGLAPPLGFDSLGRRIASAPTVAAVQQAARWTYDTNGWLSSVTSYAASMTQFIERDASGRALRIFDAPRGTGANPTGRETVFTWRPDDLPLTIRSHNVTTTFAYDDVGGTRNLVSAVDSLGRSVTYGHDVRGNVTSVTDGTTSASFDFDANNRLLRTADALGNETTYSYTHASCGCSAQDLVTGLHTPDLPAGAEWAFDYDPSGRLTTITDPDGFDESISYKPTGEIASTTDRLGRTSTMSYDQLGRLTALVDIGNRAHARSYTQPTAGVWAGASLAAGGGSSVAPSANLGGPLQDGDYQIGFNAYDAEGRPARISLYRDATFELAYTRQFDVAGRLTHRFDRANRALASVDLPRSSSDGTLDDHQVNYDARTAMPLVQSTSSSTATGNESSFTQHDVELDAATDTGFGVGIERPSSHVFTRDVAGRLTDSTNRFYTVTVASGAPLVMNAPPSHYDYRPDGRILRITNADGTHDFTYDARGLVATQVVGQGTDNPATSLDRDNGTYTYGYDEVGRNTSLTFSDGHVRTQRFDLLGRIVERCYKYPLQPSIQDRCYNATYDAVGNITRLSDPEGSDDVVVDELDRLRSVTRSGGGGVETYAYNALGALTTNASVAIDHRRPRLGGGGLADAAVPATLAGQPVTLDLGGRVTSLRGVTFNFSRAGNLRETSTGARFAVDTARRRAVQTSEYGLEAFAYEGPNIIGVVHRDAITSTDTVDEQWLFDGVDHPLRLTTSRAASGQANVVYFELDLAGNVRRVRGANGEDYGGYRYTAFGQTVEDTATATLAGLTPTVTQRVRWKGRPVYHFGGTEVYDMRARQWEPELGSFLSVDEYAFHDARGTLWSWPRQNPVRYRDPSGHLPMDGATTDRGIGSPQDWSDSNFRSGMVTGSALGALLDLHIIAAPLAYIIDAGLFVSSERELPLLGLGGNPLKSPADQAVTSGAKRISCDANPALAKSLSAAAKDGLGVYDGQIAEHALARGHFPGKTAEQIKDLIADIRANGEALQLPNGNELLPKTGPTIPT